jgi:hypothetical protein
MNNRVIFLLNVVIVIVPILLGAGSKKEASLEDFYGEWVTIDYSKATPSKPAKVICSVEGVITEYPSILSSKPSNSATFSVVDSWVDLQGNLYLKVNCNYAESGSAHSTFDLWKLDSSGSVWEFNRRLTDFPEKIDPNDPNYMIFNRQ